MTFCHSKEASHEHPHYVDSDICSNKTIDMRESE